jgi:hypothetical protein
MFIRIQRRLTFANVMSVVAVFIALGGSAYAFKLGKNSVGTKQLKKNAVTAAKIKNDAVTGAKIKSDAVTGAKIKDASVTGSELAAGAVDSSKLAANSVLSAAIANGAVSASKLGLVDTHVVATLLPDNGVLTRSVAACAPGETLIGGGVNTAAFGKDISIQGSRPSKDNAAEIAEGEAFTFWQTSAINEPGETGATSIRSWAVCLR